MRERVLSRETWIARPRPQVFEFFASAENLQRITPGELRFEITTPPPIRMAAGTRIDYQLRLFGLRFTWTTLITRWEPEHCFVDQQIRGPFAKWVHTHTFEDSGDGTRVRDEVRYALPLFPVGELAHPLIRRQLRRIFSYRGERLREVFGSGPGPES